MSSQLSAQQTGGTAGESPGGSAAALGPSLSETEPLAKDWALRLDARPALVKHGHWWKQEWPFVKDNPGPSIGEPLDREDEDDAAARGLQAVPSMVDKWRLVDLFLEYKGLVTQHLNSYNDFVQNRMKEIIMDPANNVVRSESDKRWYLRYKNVYIDEPTMVENVNEYDVWPHMCRLRDLTYSAQIRVDIEYWRGEPRLEKKVVIGRLPIMLRSCICRLHGKSEQQLERDYGECPYDPGGYFVVKGTERVLMMQENQLTNRIIVENDSNGNVQAFVTSVGSASSDAHRTSVCHHTQAAKRGLYVKLSAYTELIPVAILLKALGVQSDMEILMMVGVDKIFMDNMMVCLQDVHERGIFSEKSALQYMDDKLKFKPDAKMSGGASRRNRFRDSKTILNEQFLSHIECSNKNNAPKIRYVGLMVRRVIAAKNDKTLVHDRDYYGNKRLELSGQLISWLFEDEFKNLNEELKFLASKELNKWQQQSKQKKEDLSTYPDLCKAIDGRRLTDSMVRAISTGNWNIKRFRMDKAGVSQVLTRFAYVGMVGAMMKVKSHFEKSQKVAGPRALQPSQWGMLCPADTPEGEQCGLIKHLALLTHITTTQDERPILQLCYCMGVEDAHALSGEELHHVGNYLVLLNGRLLGVHRRPKQFMASLKKLRRFGRIGQFVSIYEDESWHAIFIASDGGRLCRPLIVVEDGKAKFEPHKHVPLMLKHKDRMTFEDFLKQGVVEWLDVNEENNAYIALTPADIVADTTHMEIEAITLLGVVSGLIPYPNHNQSPRNTYECAMGKQAMGCIAMNQFTRTDTLLVGLVHPQKPLVTSKTLNLVNFHHFGAGQNASVAVMSYSGYDIEDAIVMNRGALDRGFGRGFTMKKKVVQLDRHKNGTMDKLAPPQSQVFAGKSDERKGKRSGQEKEESALGLDGLCDPGARLEDHFIIANRCTPTNTQEYAVNGQYAYALREFRYREANPCYVDRVIRTTGREGDELIKVITHQLRRPELGDKFASRHGQKGVVGLIVGEEDMPFSETGWRPDLIMNPHGFPSRMTVGKMLECVGSKAAVMEGIFCNGSAFTNTPAREIYKTLIKHGFAPNGKEYLTSGITGEPLETYVFCGPIYYQRLKHMVQDKMHARATGRRVQLTRQPEEGRAKEGGLRLGEMERDCLVAYGASNLLLERLMYSSDVCTPTVCRKCGLFCARPDWCKFCAKAEFVTTVRMPYACKLLFQEMQAMNICCRLQLSER